MSGKLGDCDDPSNDLSDESPRGILLRLISRSQTAARSENRGTGQTVSDDESLDLLVAPSTHIQRAALRRSPIRRNSELSDQLRRLRLRGADLGNLDLHGADLSNLDLEAANLCGTDLSRANLNGARLHKASLRGARLSGATLHGADLSEALLDGAYLRLADLSKANLDGASLKRANLTEAYMHDASLCNSCLDHAELDGCNLDGACLDGASMHGASLLGTSLCSANLHGAHLEGVQFYGGRLIEASIVNVNFKGADLSGALLAGAKMIDVNLCGAKLLDADLSNANLCRVNLEDAELTDAELQGVRFDLETYQRSRWTPEFLETLHQRRAAIVGLERFPQSVHDLLIGAKEGLLLCFDVRLAPVERFLIDGVILNVLGRDTDCRIVEFREQGYTTLIRLYASQGSDLEAVAEVLYSKVWQQQQHCRSSEQALMRTSFLGDQALEHLSSLLHRMERMELRLGQHEQPAWRWDVRQDQVQVSQPMRLFYSYASEDEPLLQELERHLSVLRRQGLIQTWHRGLVLPGVAIAEQQLRQLKEAHIVLLLASAYFVSSDHLIDVQLPIALDRHAAGTARVFMLLTRPVDLTGSPLERLPYLPDDGKPVTTWSERDAAWANIATGIRRAVINLASTPSAKSLPPCRL